MPGNPPTPYPPASSSTAIKCNFELSPELQMIFYFRHSNVYVPDQSKQKNEFIDTGRPETGARKRTLFFLFTAWVGA